MKRLTLKTLISGAERQLEIFCVGGRRGLPRTLPETFVHRVLPGDTPGKNGLLIFDPAALDFIKCQRREYEQTFLQSLGERNVFLVAFSDSRRPPDTWLPALERQGIFWCVSRHDSFLLESRLLGLIREKTAGVQMIHAGLVDINGWGILLTGEAGAGKTRLAVELLQRGYGWIADDRVVLKKMASGIITGSAHRKIKGLLHLRGKGIHAATDYGGSLHIREEATIKLIVELGQPDKDASGVQNSKNVKHIMGVSIPVVQWTRPEGNGASAADFLQIVHRRQTREVCG